MVDYKDWSREDLLTRIAGLEALLGGRNGGLGRPQPGSASSSSSSSSSPSAEASASTSTIVAKGKQKKPARAFDVSAQPCRKIALRFSYDGAHYSGLAAQGPSSYSTSSTSGVTPLPTVEGVLWKALAQARLVDDAKGYEGAGWSRCGRTDRGVSAAGQVVALWIRSRRVDERKLKEREDEIRRRKWEAGNREADEGKEEEEEMRSDDGAAEAGVQGASSGAEAAAAAMEAARAIEAELGPPPSPILFDADAEELPYVVSLNRILPPTIRVHAWTPVRPDFSARFDCRYRHYKYFFTAGAPPALRPSSSANMSAGNNLAIGSGPRLDVDAMRDAARRLLGSHDFRNLCKVDSSKQVTNFVRRVDGVSIDVVPHGHWPLSAAGSARWGGDVRDEAGQAQRHAAWSAEHMYVFNLRGTAFLYHQVRHIMAVLFLVGARLESPSIVDELMNVDSGRARRDRAAVDALRRGALEAGDAGSQLGQEGRKSLQDWIDWCLPGSSATDPDGHTANTRPGGPKSDAAISARASSSDDPLAMDVDEGADALTVFETKPMYEMAADRPLVLWECGFRPVDVSWRAGTFDEALTEAHKLPRAVAAPPAPAPPTPSIDEGQDAPASSTESKLKETKASKKKTPAPPPPPPALPDPAESNRSASWRTTADLHTSWTSAAISAQIARHFVLAAPSPHVGTLPAWTHFLDAAVPVQPDAGRVELSALEEGTDAASSSATTPSPAVPIGNGLSRPHGSYLPLAKRKRGEAVEVINARWVAGRGARRAAVRGLTAEELSRGMKPRITAEEREQMREEEEGR
ncbi:pseudouridine synthase deg1 [Tilletia horrida]|uniref:Pseudouridine synthase deg1 n=1 Tax=Tilletia horrida TaxID=155126 RepID=A0AAN6GCG8_9BASI|nr:pseudouridine synthase deg1 [Tilletia horrida]